MRYDCVRARLEEETAGGRQAGRGCGGAYVVVAFLILGSQKCGPLRLELFSPHLGCFWGHSTDILWREVAGTRQCKHFTGRELPTGCAATEKARPREGTTQRRRDRRRAFASLPFAPSASRLASGHTSTHTLSLCGSEKGGDT